MRRLPIFAIIMLLLAACGGAPDAALDPLPPGDATRGAELFMQSVGGAPACSTCHTLDGSIVVGPSLQGLSQRAGTRVEGVAPEDYAHTSIVRPAAYLVSGFSNLMYPQYSRSLSSQQIADLVAYVLTL
jgi:mono/diheme cytochrome c family protein